MGCMATLYVRDVPDSVAAALKRRADADGMSVSAYVSRELARHTARPTNEEIVERLRALDRAGAPAIADIVEVLTTSRR